MEVLGIEDITQLPELEGYTECICDEGWLGSQCTIFYTCPDFAKGEEAVREEGFPPIEVGYCKCFDGYVGENCDQSCPSCHELYGTCIPNGTTFAI